MRLLKLEESPSPPPPPAAPPGRPAHHRRHAWVVGLAAGLLVAAAGTSIGYWWQQRAVPPPLVFLAPVTRGPVAGRLRATGTLEPTDSRVIVQPSAGRATEVVVRVGDLVATRQVVARFDPLAQRADLARAGSRLVAAEAEALNAELALGGLVQASPDGTEELENARALAQAKLATVASELEARLAAYRVAERHLVDRVVRAPMAGVVVARHVEPGQHVSAGAPVVTIAAVGRRLRLQAETPERELSRVRPGQSATFTVPAFPGRTFAARVIGRGALVGPEGARHFPVWLEVENPAEELTFGMTAQVEVQTSSGALAFRVPLPSLSFAPAGASSDQPAVWVGDARGRGIVRVPVEVGATDESFAEVRGPGLTEGAMVAVSFGRAPPGR
jgi:HlyD family secretion protein